MADDKEVELETQHLEDPAKATAVVAAAPSPKVASPFGMKKDAAAGGGADLFAALKGGGHVGSTRKAFSKFRKLRSNADCVICFTSPAYYYNESEGFAELDVIRLGDTKGDCQCEWKTKDGECPRFEPCSSCRGCQPLLLHAHAPTHTHVPPNAHAVRAPRVCECHRFFPFKIQVTPSRARTT